MMEWRWWDYSDYFLNLNGRVCVEGLLALALAGWYDRILLCTA